MEIVDEVGNNKYYYDSFDPAIYNPELENGIVDNRDFKVFKIKDILSQYHVDLIKKEHNRVKDYFLTQGFVGHRAWTIQVPEVEKHVTEVLSEKLGEEMILSEISYAIYAPRFGYKPKLFPHFDSHVVDGQRITVDIQLQTTIDWGIVVEEETFYIQNNEALVFSGTQQLHWREKKELSMDDEIHLIFAHFRYAKDRPFSSKQREILEYWSHRLREKVGIERDAVILDTKAIK